MMVRRPLIEVLRDIGVDPSDHADVALQKRILVRVAMLVTVAGFLWGAVYMAFGEVLAGSIPLGYAILSAVSIVALALSRRFRLFRATQFLLMVFLPFALQLALGGFVPASAVVLWAFIAPLGAMLMWTRRAATALFAIFILLVVIAAAFQPDLTVENNLPDWLVVVFFTLNVGAVATIGFVTIRYFQTQKDQARALLVAEQDRSERLLLNVLPQQIADQLKAGDSTIAEHFSEASILFADIVGFTALTSELEPDELIRILNEVFLHFDDLVERYGCEKIRTIGDNYMVASGVPMRRPDHAQSLVAMALDMVEYSKSLSSISLRVGVDSGPVVAGVIGRSKFQYDLWGEAVNTASRMESQGEPDRIQITESTQRLVDESFICIPRGVIAVKGIGDMPTWFVEGMR